MAGAQFAAVVVLIPKDKQYRKVYIQPVICSDLVGLRTSLSGPGPIAVITLEAERLGKDPPDQIDIVSAVTCTPRWTLTIIRTFLLIFSGSLNFVTPLKTR